MHTKWCQISGRIIAARVENRTQIEEIGEGMKKKVRNNRWRSEMAVKTNKLAATIKSDLP